MTYGEFLLQILDSSTDVVTAAYNTGFEAGKKYVMEQLQKFLEENEICPVLIIGKYGSWNRLAGLRPDFWIAGDDDCRAMLTMSAAKVGGVELNRIEDVLKIVEILRVEDVCK